MNTYPLRQHMHIERVLLCPQFKLCAFLSQESLNGDILGQLLFASCNAQISLALRSTDHAATGEGKAKVLDEKMTTVYKRALDMTYNLKMKASRAILSDIQMRYPCMPFPLRNLLTAGSTSKFGMVECVGHGLLHAYPVLWEKDGEIVAHIKGTVLLLPNGSDRITTCPLQPC